MPKLSIIDPGGGLRSELERTVRSLPGWRITGTYDSCPAALKCIVSDKPQVVFIALDEPGQGGLNCLRTLKSILPKAFFIAHTSAREWDVAGLILRSADSYVLAEEGMAKVHRALRLAEEKRPYVSPDILKLVLRYYQAKKPGMGRFKRLSPREMEVVRMACRGLKYKEIARALGITEGGIRQHVHRIFNKLRIRNRTELMVLYGKMLRGELPDEEE